LFAVLYASVVPPTSSKGADAHKTIQPTFHSAYGCF